MKELYENLQARLMPSLWRFKIVLKDVHKILGNELELLAEHFALERGGRSARLAQQIIDGLMSR